ncbi:hypothetical protein RUM43_007528 [Polyplax serrata]|uniref:RRM domain-containing protein n=1 Tax=Polyplax serrata TaxID=468196 RepID=A0AAN8S7X7_POLSC
MDVWKLWVLTPKPFGVQLSSSIAIFLPSIRLQPSRVKMSLDAECAGSSSRKKEDDSKFGKDRRSEGSTSESRNLWVSNLSSLTRATDLKQVFSKHGKVIGAKIVTNARTPGARCYGYVTMTNSDDAIRCIKHLHRIELHGRMISVEKAKGDATGPLKTSESRRAEARRNNRHDFIGKRRSSDRKTEDRKPAENGKPKSKPNDSLENSKDGLSDNKKIQNREKRSGPDGMAEKSKSRDGSRDDRTHGSHRSLHSHSPFRKRHSPRKEVLSFSQIKVIKIEIQSCSTSISSTSSHVVHLIFQQEERERQRLREKERRLREEAKHRREEALRQRDIDRRQKSEAARIEREKEKLRLEREKIEREKSELLRMERERQRLERERIEREKEELRMQQKRLEAARRSSKKRPSDDRRDFPDKRTAIDLGHFDAPPPPRFTEEDRRRERSRRDDFDSDRRRDSNTSRTRDDFSRKSSSTSHSAKDGRFERERDRDRDRERDRDRDISNSSYRSRDDHRSKRQDRGSSDWHSSTSQQGGAPFGSIGGPSGPNSRDPWASSDRKPDSSSWGRSESTSSDRWVTNTSNLLLGRAPSGSVIANALYQNQPGPPGMGMTLSLPSNGPYNNDRFDAYKPSLSGMRKF